MVTVKLSDTLWKLLKSVDTPTVCNAIEVAEGKRGFNAYTKRSVLTSNPKAPALVGFARTAKIAGAEPPKIEPYEVRKRRMKYFHHMSLGSDPKISVIEDEDFPNCVSAWWGEIHTTVHKGLGVLGALTNGVMRDLGDLEEGFPVISGSIGPSHAFVHVTEIGTDVSIFDLTIKNGDLIHADRHGALVIPTYVIPILEDSIKELLRTENLILGPAREPGFNFEKLEKAWTEFENSRT